MRFLVQALFGLLFAPLSLSGCPTCPQAPPSTCPLVSFGDQEARPGDGQIDWSENGKSGSLDFGGTMAHCSAQLSIGAAATDGGAAPEGATLAVTCITTDGPNVDFGLWLCLGDAYAWSPGTTAIPPATSPNGGPCDSQPRAELYYVADCGSIATCGPCRAPATVSLVVEEATGGAAPPPQLVTYDYRRTFHVDFLMPTPVVGENEDNPGTCGTGVGITGSVRFSSTPADFVYEPDLPCEEEPCLG